MRYPQSLSKLNSVRTVNTDKQPLKAKLQSAEPIEKTYWVSTILASIYFLSLFDSPLVIVSDLRWYTVLGLAIMAFIFQRKPLTLKGTRIFLNICGLGFLGAILSLFRAPNINQAASNTVGLGIGFITFLFFIPVYSSQFSRRILLLAVILSALIWCVKIQMLLSENGRLFYSTFAMTGSNKNNIGFLLSLASTALFYLAIFWRPFKAPGKHSMFFLRLALTLGGIFIIYNIMSIYARSSILSAILGGLAVLSILLIRNKGGVVAWFGVTFLVIVFYFLFTDYIFPKLLIAAPQWRYILDQFQTEGLGAYSLRESLLKKGWFIVSQNPIIGVGIGQSKGSFGYFPSYYIANFYLTEWAEKGILGLLSLVVFIVVYVKMFVRKFFDSSTFDQTWFLLFIPTFFSMLFIDMSSGTMIMAALLTGIQYNESYAKVKETPKFRR